MRTKTLKFGMPLAAFLLAIAFAFASNSKPEKEDPLLVDGYILKNEKCEYVTKCSTVPGPPCMIGTNLRAKINETQCDSELFHWSN